MDVKITFLNGELDQEVYINQPYGFIMPVMKTRFSMKDMGDADVILGIRIKHEMSTPMNTSEKLRPNNVGKLSRYASNPSTQHWKSIQWVLKYLKKTLDYSLSYVGYPSVLEGCINARWISNTEDNSSTSGCVFFLGGGAISWAFKKQIGSQVQQWNINL
ncbi:hypothetical protein Tco_1312240 [Tanacetum coccineum]